MLASAGIITKNNKRENLLNIKDFIRKRVVDSTRLQRSDNINLFEHRRNHSEESIMFDDAIQYYKNSDYEFAVDRLSNILSINPLNARAAWMLCHINANRGEFEDAIRWGNRCIEIDPLFKEAYYILSLIHLERKEYDDAIDKLKRVIYIDPNFTLSYFILGNIYTLVYLYPHSKDCLKMASDLLSSNAYDKTALQSECLTVKELLSLIELKFRTM
jgi:tetratricopeptide (TPR) repeat protein